MHARKDTFNFYLSKLRTRIIQTFGFMTTRWESYKILCKLVLKIGKVFMCITRLHNFCINEGCDIEIWMKPNKWPWICWIWYMLYHYWGKFSYSRYHSSRVGSTVTEM